MAGDVVSVLAQLAVIEAEIVSPDTGRPIKAYSNIPLTIAAAQMPCFVNFPGNLISNEERSSDADGREFWEVRDYNLVLYHSPFGAGTNEEKAGLLAPYFELVMAKFMSYPLLKGVGEIEDSTISSGTGTVTVSFLAQQYNGIRFTLRTTRRVRRRLSITD